MLAGQAYLDPLNDVLDTVANAVEYPFADTEVIGEQMGWLRERIDATKADGSDGGSDDHADSQTRIKRWT